MDTNENGEQTLSTEYYDPVAIVLSSINYNTENLSDELRKCAITYNQLSGLVEEDLRQMGMTNPKAIKEILSEIAQLPNQQRLYDSVLREEFVPENYVHTVVKNSSEQLALLRLMLEIIQLKASVSLPYNMLLEDRMYASEWCLMLCEKIHNKLDDIECFVQKGNRSKSSKRTLRKVGVSLVLLSSAVVLTLCFTKRFPKLTI